VSVSEDDARRLEAVQERSYAGAGGGVRAAWPPHRAMRAPALSAFLSSRRHGALATARADGRPQAAPVSFVVRDGSLWFATVAGQRLRNLRANPQASFVIAAGEDDEHRVVTVEGRVRVHEPTDDVVSAWAERHGSQPTWAVAMLELIPERVFSYAATQP
jgi:PPOX class probable F420-dependent enzyme